MSRLQDSQRTSPSYPPQEQRADDDFSRLMSKNVRIGNLYRTLSAADHNIEAMLPDFMKGQADRLIRRALITFSKNPDLDGITDEAFRRCVIEAAEMGFAIDGRLCYVVKYKSTYQLQLDYKAVVAVAKRNRTIKDIDADVVCANDSFRHGKFGGESVLEHTFDLAAERGDVVGAYCRVFLPDGSWNYEVMTRTQLDAVQKRAPAQNGPWKTDPDEMRKKTVIRRKLKLYQDDPGLMRMLEITAWEEEPNDDEPRPQTVADLGKRLSAPPTAARPVQHEPQNGRVDRHEYVTPQGEVIDAGERPQASAAVDESLLDKVREEFSRASDVDGVTYVCGEIIDHSQPNEATITAIKAAAEQRKAELNPLPAPGRKQKTLA